MTGEYWPWALTLWAVHVSARQGCIQVSVLVLCRSYCLPLQLLNRCIQDCKQRSWNISCQDSRRNHLEITAISYIDGARASHSTQGTYSELTKREVT